LEHFGAPGHAAPADPDEIDILLGNIPGIAGSGGRFGPEGV